MEPNDSDVLEATPVTRDAIGGAGPAYAKPRWDPKGKRNMLIVGGVVLFAVALLVLLFAGGRKNEQRKASSVVEAPPEQPVAGGMLSQADRDALKAQENARIAAALSGGRSAVGTQVGQAPSQAPATQQPNVPAPQQGAVRLDQQQPPMSQAHAAQAAAPDEAKLHGLEQQMQRMMTAWGMGGADGGAQRTLSTYIREPSKASNAAAGQMGQQQANGASMNQQRSPNDLMVVKAYEQPYAAQMMSGADSDTPGKLRARIMSGPLTGAVVTGTARRIGDQGFQADFNSASYNGRTIKIVAFGMDADASGDVVRGNYDGRYMQRYVFPVVAEGVKAYAAARAQVATTVVAIPIAGTGSTGVVTGGTQVPTPTAEQARDAMYSSGANQVSRALATGPQEGHVTLAPNTQIGIVFEESLYQSDLAGQSSQSASK